MATVRISALRAAIAFPALFGAAPFSAALLGAATASATSYRVVYSFQLAVRDGANPFAGLINVGGTLYGTTNNGGDCGGAGCGTVFKVNPNTGVERVVYAFKRGRDGASPEASLISAGGRLYGTTKMGGVSGFGTAFRVDPSTGAEQVVYAFTGGSDGRYPVAGLLNVGGTLYGTTPYGGAYGYGTVFAITP